MTLLFTNARTLTLDDIVKLDGPHQQQFVETMYGYCEAARSCTTPRACVEALGEPADEYSIELWDVVRDGVVVYEYWVQGAGDGHVFVAGNDESTFVHSVQHSFQSLTGDPDANDLARSLQQAARGVL